jgi:CheY-like chemotaxis protein
LLQPNDPRMLLSDNAAKDGSVVLIIDCLNTDADEIMGRRIAVSERLRILIVDDQRRARQSLRALLAIRFQPIETQEAENGLEAVRRVVEWRPDIVLIDARMPELDGIEATRAIKRLTPHVKVIVLSMFAEYHAAALEASADMFMSKGEPPERLLTMLSEIVDSTVGKQP